MVDVPLSSSYRGELAASSPRAFSALGLMGLLLLTLAGCGGGGGGSANPKVTKANYDQVKDDMTEKQVADILGAHSEVANDVQLPGGAGHMKLLVWKNGIIMIRLSFKNGKVDGPRQSQFVAN